MAEIFSSGHGSAVGVPVALGPGLMAPDRPREGPPSPHRGRSIRSRFQRDFARRRRPWSSGAATALARRWRYRLAPDPLQRKPKGVLPFWTRMRRLFWSWWPWAAACLWALVNDKWGWAWGTGAMAFVSYLIAPAEAAPQYGLDHEFAIDDEEFLPTMAGATGVPFLPGNALTILNDGDEFYPGDARRDRGGGVLDHDRGLHLLGGRHRRASSPRRWRRRPRRASASRSCWTRSGRRRSAKTSCKILEKGPCQLAWYNPFSWQHLGRYNHRTHRKSLIIDGRIALHRRRRHRGPLARPGAASRRMARPADPDRRSGGHAAADRLRAELAADDGRAGLRVRSTTRSSSRPGRWRCRRS